MHGVEGRAFAELVAACEKLDASAVGLTYILADAADEDVVAAGRVNEHWKTIRLHIVYHCYARRLCKNGSRAVAGAFAGSSPQQPTA